MHSVSKLYDQKDNWNEAFNAGNDVLCLPKTYPKESMKFLKMPLLSELKLVFNAFEMQQKAGITDEI
jgi:hypothetical protein